ncbi:MAG: hypothetical protein ACYDB7_10595, partial [Mycobacteriales bacterium]
ASIRPKLGDYLGVPVVHFRHVTLHSSGSTEDLPRIEQVKRVPGASRSGLRAEGTAVKERMLPR